MNRSSKIWLWFGICLLCLVLAGAAIAAGDPPEDAKAFPPSLDSYNDADIDSIMAILKNRVHQVPFNLVATIIFCCAIIHTFLTGKFMAIAHRWEHDHEEKKKAGIGGQTFGSPWRRAFSFSG